MREAADRDAERTREEALERARAHVAAVAQAAAGLLERVGSMDGEVGALVESLRAGASRLAGDLAAVESGHARALRRRLRAHAEGPRSRAPARLSRALSRPSPSSALAAARAPPTPAAPLRRRSADRRRPRPRPARRAESSPPQAEAGAGDLDGARLVALNMALNGESRAETERYLAENFQLPDRLKLIDEVYAAIEG